MSQSRLMMEEDKHLKCIHFDFVKSHARKGGLGILGEVAGVTLVADTLYLYSSLVS